MWNIYSYIFLNLIGVIRRSTVCPAATVGSSTSAASMFPCPVGMHLHFPKLNNIYHFSDHLTNLSRSSCKLCLSVSLVNFLNTFRVKIIVLSEVAIKIAFPACFTSHKDLAFSKQKYTWPTYSSSRSLSSRLMFCKQISRLTVNNGGGGGRGLISTAMGLFFDLPVLQSR